MRRKLTLLAALAAGFVVLTASPAWAGAGAAGAWQNRGGQREGGDRGARGGGGRADGQRASGGQRGGQAWRGQAQRPQESQPRQWQGGRNRFSGNPSWANRGGDSHVDGQRSNQGQPRDFRREGDRRFDGGRFGQGQTRDFRRDGENRFRNSPVDRAPRYANPAPRFNYRYRDDDRRRRAYAAIPYGGYFGPSFGGVISRYYGRHFEFYGARAWPYWRRPYRIGYLLPPSLYCEPLPYDLYYELAPPPLGYDYALCDGDILLIAEDSGLVVDAIIGW
jgi:hypothetical protein